MTDQSDKSGLVLYSLGIVVATKEPGTDTIFVTPIEHLNIQDNKLIKDSKQTFKSSLPDKDGKVSSTEVKASNTLTAKWIPFGHSNRNTAPDVVASETVILFKFSDADEYYWTTIFRENSLRRLENVLYSYSNLPTGINAYSMTTSYWMNMNTKQKKVHLHTSNNDGEHCTYDVSLDTKQGILTIVDGKKNIIELSSKTDSLNIKVNNNISATAGNTVTVTAGTSVTVKAPSITLDGNVTITGNLSTGGSTKLSGGVNMGAALKVGGRSSSTNYP